MNEPKKKGSSLLKKLVYAIVIGFFGWLIYKNIGDFKTLLLTIQSANYVVLGFVVLFGLGNLVIFSFIFQKSFQIISDGFNYPKLLSKTIIYYFLSISNPLGITGSSSYLLNYVVGQGISHIRAFFGLLITNLLMNSSYLVIFVISLFNLYKTNNLEKYQEYGALLLLGLNIALILVLIFFTVLPSFSAVVAHLFISVLNFIFKPVLRRELIKKDSIENYSAEAKALSEIFRNSFGKFLRTIPISLSYHLVNVVTLFLSFYAFDLEVPLIKVITLYGIIGLFSIISPTPQGIGVVEGLAQSAAISSGISGSGAIVAILTYRLAVIWIPSLLGMILFRLSREDD